jgi:hypothetical protein
MYLITISIYLYNINYIVDVSTRDWILITVEVKWKAKKILRKVHVESSQFYIGGGDAIILK